MAFELHRAVESNNQELAEFLIKNGADVNEIEIENKTPLFYAISENNFKLVEMLLKYDAKIHLNNYSYLFLALNKSIKLNIYKAENELRNINYHIVKLLIDKGGNLNDFAKEGTNISVTLSLLSFYYPLIELLLDKGANIEKYEYPLRLAIRLQDIQPKLNYGLSVAKLIISYVLSEYQPKEKPDFIMENKELSNHWDSIIKKTNYLLENPVIGGKNLTEEFLNGKLLYKTDSLKSLSLTQFFKSLNADVIENNISNPILLKKN